MTTAGTAATQPPVPKHGPNRGGPGPWDQDVLVFRAGVEGAPERLATFERAGVPTVARLPDGRLLAAFQHFPADDERHFDRVAVRFSSDEGRSWTRPQPIVVEGTEPGLARPFDPTLVPLPDGRTRLYFTSNRSPDFRRRTPAIYSAVAADGVNYVFEPCVRFGLEGRVVIDCAVARHDGIFHLIAPDNGTAEDFMPSPGPGGKAGWRPGAPPAPGERPRREPPGAARARRRSRRGAVARRFVAAAGDGPAAAGHAECAAPWSRPGTAAAGAGGGQERSGAPPTNTSDGWSFGPGVRSQADLPFRLRRGCAGFLGRSIAQRQKGEDQLPAGANALDSGCEGGD